MGEGFDLAKVLEPWQTKKIHSGLERDVHSPIEMDKDSEGEGEEEGA